MARPGSSRPPWCGQCDERTRFRLDGNRLPSPASCPECGPPARGNGRSTPAQRARQAVQPFTGPAQAEPPDADDDQTFWAGQSGSNLAEWSA